MTKNTTAQISYKTYSPFSQFEIVKDVWTSMLKICPHRYFLSWAWTETWIKSLPSDCGLCLVVGYQKESPVVAFFIGSKTIVRHKFFKINQISLNLTLVPAFDLLYIEYNSVLINPKCIISLQSIIENIPIKSWDELLMKRHAIFYKPELIKNLSSNDKYNIEIKKIISYYVDLEKVRINNDYPSLLSKNKRKQIRRTIKEYEKIGKIRVKVAERLEDALTIFDDLMVLHQKEWTKRGHSGVFSNQHFIEFHKNLIRSRFHHKEIQLIKISAGDHIVGCLYNFIYNGQVLCYQSGYNYMPGNVYRPGLVCDYFTITHNAKIGLNEYDFLAGASEYKKSLSTNCNEMLNIAVHKKTMKYYLEKYLVKLHRAYKRV